MLRMAGIRDGGDFVKSHMLFWSRRLVVVFGAVLISSLLAGVALAKGPVEVTITGPGMDEPLEVISEALAEQSGLYVLLFGQSGEALPAKVLYEPSGATYDLTWHWYDGTPLPATLYPFVWGGPLVYMEPGLYVSDSGQSGVGARGGWFQADPSLIDSLSYLGIPINSVEEHWQSKFGIDRWRWDVVASSSAVIALAALFVGAGAVIARIRQVRSPAYKASSVDV